ncbi:protein efr3-like protein a protein [Lasius niger]|uniref:Protein efr3-like protein a protein n=1 Tax=Lasius niger TaxID=67767 RepID=A0A0J7L8R8_LASNI|nr:protein efr3-like protein a protein [Lasius niger]
MITDEDLAQRVNDISQSLSTTLSPTQQDKILDKIVKIVRNATREQLQFHHPRALVTSALKILLLYEDLLHTNGLCEWKRRRRFKIASDCYLVLLKSYLPERSRDVVETVVEAVCQDRLWEFETFCFEVMCSLLDVNSASGGLITHVIWDKLSSPEISVKDARGIVRVLYELLDVYEWPATQETVATVERMLGLFHSSIIARSTATSDASISAPYASLKKGLEVCLRNTINHLSNDQLLVIVQHMCSWTVAADATDEIVLEFGSTLEYAAYTHRAGLYEQTLTPTIFTLLMRMVGSTSRLTSLLGNRVLQYLLDRRNNRAVFDTPRIFFEHTRVNLRVASYREEDRLFFKVHRESLHDSLLRSLANHSDSRMNLETTYCTMCLIAIEVPCGFTAAALVCLAMNLQEIVLQRRDGPLEVACHVHATIISVMSLICWIHRAKVFYNYVNRIVMERAQWAPHLNPPIQSQYIFAVHHVLWNKPELFFIDWEARYGLWKCFRLVDSHDSVVDRLT